jgi:phage baseplate assembly protein W
MLPLGGTPLFKLSYTTEEQALSNLKNLLLTRKGERPLQPLFGTDVYSLLFEQLETTTQDQLKEGLSEDIAFWLPYIIVDNININQIDDYNKVEISLSVRVTENGANVPIIITVSPQGSVSIA